MTRLERTSDALIADLSPRHWGQRTLGAAVFSLVLLVIGVGLLIHGTGNHWRCDDPIVVWFLFATIALCITWAVREERARQMLVMDRRTLRLQRGWGPFATLVEAQLAEVVFEEHDGALFVHTGKSRLRLTVRGATERARLLSCCRSHQRTHSIRLR
jgi:hypothetical protein